MYSNWHIQMFQALRKAVSGNYAKDPRNSLVQDEYRKKNLKEYLVLHIKQLQKRHIHGEQIIERNDEDAANLCQALEAILLHEYRMQSISIPNINNINLRMMFTEGIKTDDAIISIAFWDLLKEVTHNDVITELKHLVVTTEVGLCRAWIRLALNDGLLVSYLGNILSNQSQLKRFYGVNAFLMDTELPYILKELLQGVMHFEFQLNYNSSKLNTWDKKTLQLAGVVEYVSKDNDVGNHIHNSPQSNIKTFSFTDTRSNEGISSKIDSSHGNIVRHTSTSRDSVTEQPKSNVRNVIARIVLKPELESHADYLVGTEGKSEVKSNAKVLNPEGTENSLTRYQNKNDVMANLRTSPNNEDKNLLTYKNNGNKNIFTSKDNGDEQLSSSKNNGDKILPTYGHDGSENTSTSGDLSFKNNGDKSISMLRSDEYSSIEAIADITQKTDGDTTTCKNHGDTSAPTSKNNGDASLPNSKNDVDTNAQNYKNDGDTNAPNCKNDGDTNAPNCKNDGDTSAPPKNEEYIVNNISKLNNVINNVSGNVRNLVVPKTVKIVFPKHSLKNDNEDVTVERDIVKSMSISENKCIETFPKGCNLQKPAEITEEKVGSGVDAIVDVIEDSSEGNNQKLNEDILPGNRLNGMGWSGWSSTFDNTNDIGGSTETDGFDSPDSDCNNGLNESFGSILQIYGNSPNYVPAEYLKMQNDGFNTDNETSLQEETELLNESNNSLMKADSQLIHLNFEVVPLDSIQGHTDNKVLSSLKQLTEIATETGLDKQSFCCQYCGVLIGLIYGPYRVCRYDGAYYCYDCHNSEEHIIPARVIQDWDFRKYKVSKYNKLFLMKIEEEPLFHMDEINSLLYDVAPDLKEMKYLRIQLQHIKEYVQTCRQEVAEDFRRRLWPREYLCDDIHQYSLLDLLQVYNGQQAHHLRKIITQFSKHIYKCTLCCQKGFICEYCHDNTIIYPFQVSIAVQCQGCLATFHKKCRQDKRCPKCVRIRLRFQSKGKTENETDRLLVTQKEQSNNRDIL